MPLYQNTSVNSDALVLGNWKIQVATYSSAYGTPASVASSVTNLGAGMINSFGHNVTMIDVQAGNAPDPLEGIATETFSVTGDLIEFDVANVTTAWGGLVTTATVITTTLAILSAGGKTTLTPKTFLLTNRRIVGTASVETNVIVYKAYMTNGPQWTAKSDNDADPINSYSFEVRGEIDATRTAGDQLYSIHKWLD
jgi:hypothetical protein